MKKHFNKNVIMSEEEEYSFQQNNSCWICKKIINDDNEKVRDHCHITSKSRGAAHQNCNLNFQLTKRIPVIFHNLKGYDSHLIFSVLHKFNLKINVIPNGSEKNMALTVLTVLQTLLAVCNLLVLVLINLLKIYQMKILNI